jgi:hypothetical protein
VSNALAIAGVTAVLRDLLSEGMVTQNVSGLLGTTVTVSALPPDRVVPTNGTENTQLNLFLHQVTFNSGWRNQALPSRDGSGRHRLSNPPLALDLHYLISAYSAEEFGGEVLLGHAMQVLHERPVLDRQTISAALTAAPTLPPALRALADCGLADQVEQIKLVPEVLSTEEMSKLWTAVQSNYRPSAAYLATVVLIESTQPARAPLPVLSRGPVDSSTGRDRGVIVTAGLLPPFPTIESVAPADGQPAATVGDPLELTGHHLDGTGRVVVFSNARFGIDQEAAAEDGNAASSVEVEVPNLPVGVYQVAVRLVRPGDSVPRTSNQLAMTLGPEITTFPATVARDGSGTATITLSCQPEIRPGQRVSLLLGAAEAAAPPVTAASSTVTFAVEQAPVGEHLVRLRVDGIDSPLIDRQATPPVFLEFRITIT